MQMNTVEAERSRATRKRPSPLRGHQRHRRPEWHGHEHGAGGNRLCALDSLVYRQSDFACRREDLPGHGKFCQQTSTERLYDITRRCGFQYPNISSLTWSRKRASHEGKADVAGFSAPAYGRGVQRSFWKSFSSDAVGVPEGTFTAAFLEGKTERKNELMPCSTCTSTRTPGAGSRQPRCCAHASRN